MKCWNVDLRQISWRIRVLRCSCHPWPWLDSGVRKVYRQPLYAAQCIRIYTQLLCTQTKYLFPIIFRLLIFYGFLFEKGLHMNCAYFLAISHCFTQSNWTGKIFADFSVCILCIGVGLMGTLLDSDCFC